MGSFQRALKHAKSRRRRQKKEQKKKAEMLPHCPHGTPMLPPLPGKTAGFPWGCSYCMDARRKAAEKGTET